MKQASVFTILVAVIFLVSCAHDIKNENSSDKSVYPHGLAGVWQADGSLKTLEFDDKGKLVSFTNAAGLRILVSEGGVSQKGRDDKSMLYLILGDTLVEYDTEKRVLEVVINFDDYRIEVAGGSVSGTIKESVKGVVNWDDMTWLATSTVQGTLENLPQANDSSSENILFRKIK